MSLQEKGWVVQLAVTLLGKAVEAESILSAATTTRCRSLVPRGDGTLVGVQGRPIFKRPMAVWHHLHRMRKYSSERWARQQQAKVARQRWKQRRTP